METRRSSGCRTGGFHHRWLSPFPAVLLVIGARRGAVLVGTMLFGTVLLGAAPFGTVLVDAGASTTATGQAGAGGSGGGQTGTPTATASQYENDASPAALYAQGEAAGSAGAQGMVILDFGRPAAETTLGTITQDDTFASFPSIAAAVESYVAGYFRTAPAALRLHVAIGTNDSCGTGQPCGSVVCGCAFEPPSFRTWGATLASTVESVQAWATRTKQQSSFTDTVTVVAGDDVEPAFDPGYLNTYNVLAGYAAEVGGYQPAMVDYGSAEPGYWTSAQLLQVADGFRPDVVFPEVYFPTHVTEWASLIGYAKAHGQNVTIFGVLTQAPDGQTSATSYASIERAIAPITGQSSIQWASNIGP
jgi:hypothetical protein